MGWIKYIRLCRFGQTKTISLSSCKISFLSVFKKQPQSLLSAPLSAAPLWQGAWTAGSLPLVGAVLQLLLEGLEVWPVGWLGAPTSQHDFVEKLGTFGRSWQPVPVGHLLVHFLVAKGWWSEAGGERRNRSELKHLGAVSIHTCASFSWSWIKKLL